jgi:hypothetical protein
MFFRNILYFFACFGLERNPLLDIEDHYTEPEPPKSIKREDVEDMV